MIENKNIIIIIIIIIKRHAIIQDYNNNLR